MNILLQILTLVYASIGIISAVAYWPTIKDLYHKKPSANITSYQLWTATSAIAVLYGWFILKDLPYKFVSGIGFIACATILILSMRIKKSTFQ